MSVPVAVPLGPWGTDRVVVVRGGVVVGASVVVVDGRVVVVVEDDVVVVEDVDVVGDVVLVLNAITGRVVSVVSELDDVVEEAEAAPRPWWAASLIPRTAAATTTSETAAASASRSHWGNARHCCPNPPPSLPALCMFPGPGCQAAVPVSRHLHLYARNRARPAAPARRLAPRLASV
ncbi:MAG: hypothetical protein E6G27_00780 [Actinobacteria bacterium]|nr:MAG: hypothetical protein E6G27_00780 [Actinomycetota bacterium]